MRSFRHPLRLKITTVINPHSDVGSLYILSASHTKNTNNMPYIKQLQVGTYVAVLDNIISPALLIIRLRFSRIRRLVMKKFLIVSVFFGIFIFWMSVLVDAYSADATSQTDPAATPVTLLLLGSILCALSFWGKRPRVEE